MPAAPLRSGLDGSVHLPRLPDTDSGSPDEGWPFAHIGNRPDAACDRLGIQRSQCERRALLALIKKNRSRRHANEPHLYQPDNERYGCAVSSSHHRPGKPLDGISDNNSKNLRLQSKPGPIASRPGLVQNTRLPWPCDSAGKKTDAAVACAPGATEPSESRNFPFYRKPETPQFPTQDQQRARETPDFGRQCQDQYSSSPEEDDVDQPQSGAGCKSKANFHASGTLPATGSEYYDDELTCSAVSCAFQRSNSAGLSATQAAVILQRVFRGFHVRAYFKRKSASACVLQRQWRAKNERETATETLPFAALQKDQSTNCFGAKPCAPPLPRQNRAPLSVEEARRKLARTAVSKRCSSPNGENTAVERIQNWYRLMRNTSRSQYPVLSQDLSVLPATPDFAGPSKKVSPVLDSHRLHTSMSVASGGNGLFDEGVSSPLPRNGFTGDTLLVASPFVVEFGFANNAFLETTLTEEPQRETKLIGAGPVRPETSAGFSIRPNAAQHGTSVWDYGENGLEDSFVAGRIDAGFFSELDTAGNVFPVEKSFEHNVLEWVQQCLSQLYYIAGSHSEVPVCWECRSRLQQGGLCSRGLFCSFQCFGRYVFTAAAGEARKR